MDILPKNIAKEIKRQLDKDGYTVVRRDHVISAAKAAWHEGQHSSRNSDSWLDSMAKKDLDILLGIEDAHD